jgi:hypothetical protein
MHAQAVRQEMPAAKCCRVVDQFVEIQPDGRIVRADHRAGANSDDRINRNAVLNQLPNDTDVGGAAQPTGT